MRFAPRQPAQVAHTCAARTGGVARFSRGGSRQHFDDTGGDAHVRVVHQVDVTDADWQIPFVPSVGATSELTRFARPLFGGGIVRTTDVGPRQKQMMYGKV